MSASSTSPIGIDRRVARCPLFFGLHGVFEVENDEVGAGLAGLSDRARIGGRQEENRPDGEQVEALVAFCFRLHHHGRIMRPTGQIGEEKC